MLFNLNPLLGNSDERIFMKNLLKLPLQTRFAGVNLFRNRRRPFSVGLLTTFRCNFNCEFCRLTQLEMEEMTNDETIALLGQFRNIGTKRLGISGGEPLMRKNIGTIITAANQLGFWVTVNTNGFLMVHRKSMTGFVKKEVMSGCAKASDWLKNGELIPPPSWSLPRVIYTYYVKR